MLDTRNEWRYRMAGLVHVAAKLHVIGVLVRPPRGSEWVVVVKQELRQSGVAWQQRRPVFALAIDAPGRQVRIGIHAGGICLGPIGDHGHLALAAIAHLHAQVQAIGLRGQTGRVQQVRRFDEEWSDELVKVIAWTERVGVHAINHRIDGRAVDA